MRPRRPRQPTARRRATAPPRPAPEAGGGSLTALALMAADSADEPREEDPARDGPLRRCVATRAVKPKSELLRFVVGPGDVLVPDVAGRLPGRGLWITPARDIMAE